MKLAATIEQENMTMTNDKRKPIGIHISEVLLNYVRNMEGEGISEKLEDIIMQHFMIGEQVNAVEKMMELHEEVNKLKEQELTLNRRVTDLSAVILGMNYIIDDIEKVRSWVGEINRKIDVFNECIPNRIPGDDAAGS